MQAEEVRDYCLSKAGATEGFPFDQETLVFKVGGKLFLLMSLEKQPLAFNVKTDPNWSEELREQYPQIIPGYHMSKKHWNTIYTEGLKRNLLLELINHSYDLVFSSLSKKQREEILSQR
ncbi:MAG: MmcQ/YjbR family DNA-binding protein [Cloacibacterium sp.]|nr:MmcQ/YjbR family DNA-binding protein [Cloacibacterium sp.]